MALEEYLVALEWKKMNLHNKASLKMLTQMAFTSYLEFRKLLQQTKSRRSSEEKLSGSTLIKEEILKKYFFFKIKYLKFRKLTEAYEIL